jgi:hypothetical protein
MAKPSEDGREVDVSLGPFFSRLDIILRRDLKYMGVYSSIIDRFGGMIKSIRFCNLI